MALDLMLLSSSSATFAILTVATPTNGVEKFLASQFAGLGLWLASCNYMLGLEGNRDPNLSPEQRNVRQLVLLEDREFGEVGRWPMYWDVTRDCLTRLNNENCRV
jgi:hypothetical protein